MGNQMIDKDRIWRVAPNAFNMHALVGPDDAFSGTEIRSELGETCAIRRQRGFLCFLQLLVHLKRASAIHLNKGRLTGELDIDG